MTASTEKRLFKYALLYKKGIIIGILFLAVATALELAGPFIAKVIIDDHVLAIEGTWHETENADKQTALYNNQAFTRNPDAETPATGNTITVFAIGKHYYLAEGEIPLQGKREVHEGTIKIGEESVQATKLSLDEIYHFFKPEQRPIIQLLLLYFVLLLVAGVFQFFQTFLLQKSSNQIVKRMRNDIFTHTQTIPINYYVDQPAGKIVARITNDTEAIRDLYERVLSIVTTRVIYMAGILIAIFLLDVRTGFICLGVIPAIIIIARIYKHFGSKYNTIIRKANSEINGNINEAIQGMPIIQAFQVEDKRQKILKS